MNSCTVVGKISRDAEMRTVQGSSTRFLSFTVEYLKRFPSGKKFNERFKVLFFGKKAEEVQAKCREGACVMVVGEVGIDQPESSDRKPSLKLVATQVDVLEVASEPPPRRNPPPPPQDDDVPPDEDDDTPF